MYTEVIYISLFTAIRSKWRPCHTHTVNRKQKISIPFHVTSLKSVHLKFGDILIKFVGGNCMFSVFCNFGGLDIAGGFRRAAG